MNFQKIKPVKKYDEYLNNFFRSARNIKDYVRKIDKIKNSINKEIVCILDEFFGIEELDDFYREIIRLEINLMNIKKVFSNLIFVKRKSLLLSEEYKFKIKNVENKSKLLKEYYGRISSLFRRYKKDFEFLESVRKELRKLPLMKKRETIGIIGYPNVGKSTLLKRLTKADPKINGYAFTTQKINIGYLEDLQILDLPGNLNRDFNKMNKIEKYTYLAVKYLCNKLIFVFDLSEGSGDIKIQEDLFRRILEKFKSKKITIFFSKIDLVEKNLSRKYKKKYKKFNTFGSYRELRKYLVS